MTQALEGATDLGGRFLIGEDLGSRRPAFSVAGRR